jgi:Flp pilus assembly protein TadD
VLAARARQLGPEHPDTLTSMSLLGSALYQIGRLGEAEQLHRQVLRSRAHVLGPDHPETAISRHHLALALRDLNRLDEAETELRAAWDVFARALAPHHPYTRAAEQDLERTQRLRVPAAALPSGGGRHAAPSGPDTDPGRTLAPVQRSNNPWGERPAREQ